MMMTMMTIMMMMMMKFSVWERTILTILMTCLEESWFIMSPRVSGYDGLYVAGV